MTWREYHNFTKHTAEKLRRTQHFLDWANMPDPFRHYEGVPVLDLPADPHSLEIPALELLAGSCGTGGVVDGSAFLSQLLFHSAAISASKLVPSTGYRYALRVNPSSGNLHPTEFHFVTRGLSQWPDGLYHYRPSSHMAEQRAAGEFSFPLDGSSAPLTFVLTSIAWREAWKYRDRAYRYCLHDLGHAWAALDLAARAMGCETLAYGCFPDDEIAQACRLNADEWPMLVVELRGAIPRGERVGGATIWHGGEANRLSTEPIVYAPIEELHAATKFVSPGIVARASAGSGGFSHRPNPAFELSP
ncbi:MAG TPA: SagB/ThcOx family dehydrogenase, partial [Bryobacteraceae bacterium]|nr:SagB/ThcOx family dehydrogenase [Bryobacteraceae bacterium]